MPYVEVKVAEKLTKEQKEKIVEGITKVLKGCEQTTTIYLYSNYRSRQGKLGKGWKIIVWFIG